MPKRVLPWYFEMITGTKATMLFGCVREKTQRIVYHRVTGRDEFAHFQGQSTTQLQPLLSSLATSVSLTCNFCFPMTNAWSSLSSFLPYSFCSERSSPKRLENIRTCGATTSARASIFWTRLLWFTRSSLQEPRLRFCIGSLLPFFLFVVLIVELALVTDSRDFSTQRRFLSSVFRVAVL